MPCYEPRESDSHTKLELNRLERTLNKVEAMLCALLSVIELKYDLPTILNDINEEETGVAGYDIKYWWVRHKAFDAKRREARKLELQIAQKKQKAIEKLTAEERKILGLK